MLVNDPKIPGTPRTDPLTRFSHLIRERFSLDEDKADEPGIIQSISRVLSFGGLTCGRLFSLFFIASIGLNVNSTAVIIGAMLISPLMGPIMGIGLGIGINDLTMIQRALKNLSLAVCMSCSPQVFIFSSAPCILLSQKLLARTSPTVWDAFIAFFGGLAGIVAGSRRDKGTNVVPGVAIATALMPPLCTAGYGLSTGNVYTSRGHLFISYQQCLHQPGDLSDCPVFNFHQKAYPSPEVERRVRHTIWAGRAGCRRAQ